MEFDRIPQIGGIAERADLQMVVFIEADDLPAVSDRALQFPALAFQEPIWQPACTVPLIIGKAGCVDAEYSVIRARYVRHIGAIFKQALAGADNHTLRLLAQRQLTRILHTERVLADHLRDQDTVFHVDR